MNKTGFGFLRLPLLDPGDKSTIDYLQVNQLVDTYIENGGVWFDTCPTYHECFSEVALRKAVVERYPRGAYKIIDKLPGWDAQSYEECCEAADLQLQRCGVDYFDIFFLHWLSAEHYEICQAQDQFRLLRDMKADGRAKAIGFSYHGSPELLDRILTDHPETDYVMMQINYLDWEDSPVMARRCYETAVRHGKKILVMEPVKGGMLADLPEKVKTLLRGSRPGDSDAKWAIRFVSSLEHVETVFSGMNTQQQIRDNMAPLNPLTDEEYKLVEQVVSIIREKTAVDCTSCGYCISHCPQNIPIPQFFELYNSVARDPHELWKIQYIYDRLSTEHSSASACIACRRCEKKCPQNLEISSFMKDISKVFESEE